MTDNERILLSFERFSCKGAILYFQWNYILYPLNCYSYVFTFLFNWIVCFLPTKPLFVTLKILSGYVYPVFHFF